jgi:wobble nucleotide-excising tRNase
MITEIYLKNVATYPKDTEEQITHLTKVNFFYGANGSGKTTISRFIHNPSAFTSCRTQWSGIPLNTLVYNEDFVAENIFQSEEIKGVYTFGQDAKLVEEQIISVKAELSKIQADIENCTQTLSTKESERGITEHAFIEDCWRMKQKYDDTFEEAFTGFRNDAKKFKDKILAEVGNTYELKDLEYLKAKAKVVFDRNIQKHQDIIEVDSTKLQSLEDHEITSRNIIGKSDVKISDMIAKLGTSDWIKTGRGYFNKNEGICPFCQESTSQDFQRQLEEYFDETFESQVKELQKFRSDYAHEFERLLADLNRLLFGGHEFLNKAELEKQIKLLNAQKDKNLALLDGKIEKPSNAIQLQSSKELFQETNVAIQAAQNEIVTHNITVANIVSEKITLIGQVWRFVLEELKNQNTAYQKKTEDLSKAVGGLKKSTRDKETKRGEQERLLHSLESQITSIESTISEINGILKSFGFSNFSLAKANRSGFYKIIRENGRDAKKTLSEGEKTFLSFLYFFHLIKGSNDSGGVLSDRVVVFDDPISSLDSDILFIVSSLIRRIIEEIRAGKGPVKQVIILTHNVYFHKEITFKLDGNDFGHWLVRKKQGCSSVTKCLKNPVKTSYQILWDEIKDGNAATVHNTMRRILESYFKILGGIPIENLDDRFDGEDKMVCKSLISWIHAGSHAIADDMYVDNGEDVREKYHMVFKAIFVKLDHIAHYNMMMGT